MAIKRGRGTSASQLTKLMTGGKYRQAVQRGKRAEAGGKLTQRRKGMVKDLEGQIKNAEEQYQEELRKAEGEEHSFWDFFNPKKVLSDPSIFLDGLTTIFGAASMFNPGFSMLSMLTSGISTSLKTEELKDFFWDDKRKNKILG